MALLASLFKKKSAPVTVPYSAIKALIVGGDPAAYQSDCDYTDVVFRIMGIGRIHHPFAKTTRYLTDPEQTFSLGIGHDLENPLKLFASSGLFVTAYKTLPHWENGLAVIIRDSIADVRSCQPGKNVILGLKGVNMGDDRFLVTGIACGKMDKKGQIYALEYKQPNQPDADAALALGSILMRQMRQDKALDLPASVAELRGLSQKERQNTAALLHGGPK